MKKYISILSLAAAFFLQSCERSYSDLDEQKQDNPNLKISNHKEFSKTQNSTSDNNNINNFKIGDDDEPPRDKQHWRIVNDTIR